MRFKASMLAAALTLIALPGAEAAERRCGWLHNPTPGNWWLVDRDGEWVLALQGSEPVPGMDDIPDMTTAGWVRTNGHYGHGCACFQMETDRSARRVLRILSAQPLPLARCRGDRALPQP